MLEAEHLGNLQETNTHHHITHRPDGVVGYHVSLTSHMTCADKVLGSNPSLVISFAFCLFLPLHIFAIHSIPCPEKGNRVRRRLISLRFLRCEPANEELARLTPSLPLQRHLGINKRHEERKACLGYLPHFQDVPLYLSPEQKGRFGDFDN